MIRLHEDWPHRIRHAWSIRFIVLAALLEGLQGFLPTIQPYLPINPMWVSIAIGVAAAGGFVSVLLAQDEFKEVEHGTTA